MTASEATLRDVLSGRLRSARAWTDSLFALLTPAGLSERPVAERHRLLFYLGHLEAFDWNLVCRDVLGLRSSKPHFEQLFAFGIDPIDGSGPTDSIGDWPEPAAVLRWNQELRSAVDEAVARSPLTGWLEAGWALHLALEHRLMHGETLSYLLYRLESKFKVSGPPPTALNAVSGEQRWVNVPAGRAVLGLARQSQPHLGWDNEYEQHTVDVGDFELERRAVNNGDWLQFIAAGGYRERALWTDDDWAWRDGKDITHPAFWRFREGQWWWKAMFADVPLPEAWPVYVSHAEASAYARWKSARLPTEPEWHRAIEGLEPTTWTPKEQANFGARRFDPLPGSRVETTRGLTDLIGNGWEWTSTVFAPFEGFEPLPFYRNYSANFFDGKHFVLKGASAATDVAFLRPTFRNWFQPHYQHVFAKFRLARGAHD